MTRGGPTQSYRFDERRFDAIVIVWYKKREDDLDSVGPFNVNGDERWPDG
jgi:hypothetical protein